MPTKQPLRFEQATKRAERYVADADKLSQLLQRATRPGDYFGHEVEESRDQ